jgi:hypothetical protein
MAAVEVLGRIAHGKPDTDLSTKRTFFLVGFAVMNSIIADMMRKISWGVRATVLTIAFFLSTGFLFILFVAMSLPGAAGDPTEPPPTNWPMVFGVVATAVTSLSTFAGLVLSLIKERRESRKSDIEVRRMELELERTSIELAALRKQSASDN